MVGLCKVTSLSCWIIAFENVPAGTMPEKRDQVSGRVGDEKNARRVLTGIRCLYPGFNYFAFGKEADGSLPRWADSS